MKQYSKARLYLSIAAISFIQGLQFCVSPVLGDIQAHYPDVNVSLIQMLITAPGLFSLVVALVSGWLVLRITKKQMLVFAGLVAGITGFLPLLHDSFTLLLVSRTVYGISLGIATTMNMAVVAEFFEGQDRVKAMGFQAACVGAGMVVTTVCAGILGRSGFRNSYFINVIGFISMILLIVCLPETGVAKETKTEKIRLNGKVFLMDLFALLEFFFLITYTTNIAPDAVYGDLILLQGECLFLQYRGGYRQTSEGCRAGERGTGLWRLRTYTGISSGTTTCIRITKM